MEIATLAQCKTARPATKQTVPSVLLVSISLTILAKAQVTATVFYTLVEEQLPQPVRFANQISSLHSEAAVNA
jgi:hypothetical protein